MERSGTNSHALSQIIHIPEKSIQSTISTNKIDIENTGTANIVVDGTIDFTNTSLPNLKYKLMTDSTTLDTSFNSRYGYGDMEDRPMVKGLSLEPEQVEKKEE